MCLISFVILIGHIIITYLNALIMVNLVIFLLHKARINLYVADVLYNLEIQTPSTSKFKRRRHNSY